MTRAFGIIVSEEFNIEMAAIELPVTNLTAELSDAHLIPYRNHAVKLFLSFTMVLIITVSLFGNGLVVLIVILNKKMKTRTNLLIISLAIADIGLAAIAMPFSLITVLRGDWLFSKELCYFNAFTNALFFIASLHGLMYISIFKYFCILRPLKRIVTKKKTILMIVGIWATAVVCAIGPFFSWTTNEYKPGATQCGPAYPESVKQKTHAVFVATTGYVIPLSTMAFCYGRMFFAIHAHAKRMKKNTSILPTSISNTQKKATITMFIVMAIFVLCWTPYFVYASCLIVRGFHYLPLWFNSFAYWCGYANSAINPMVYVWRYESFRKAFRKLLCCHSQLLLSGSSPMGDMSPVSSRKTSIIPTPPLAVRYTKISLSNSLQTTPTGSPKIRIIQPPPLPELKLNGINHKYDTENVPEGHIKFDLTVGDNDISRSEANLAAIFVNVEDGLGRRKKTSRRESIAKFFRTRFKSVSNRDDISGESESENDALHATSCPSLAFTANQIENN
ncbi:trace amine-associated receptor 1-like [Saccoglossus kowalevskii]|uniref:Beta-1 adrenergic receptor-like n=1 Tax=Saccoglossus kowalevskii TaxID=10224 RepID=A0ABM0GT69_SACKO|nr:PREDICTED: beta-1 adrenergic receptor-like [Saccoglossus kowalevskii]